MRPKNTIAIFIFLSLPVVLLASIKAYGQLMNEKDMESIHGRIKSAYYLDFGAITAYPITKDHIKKEQKLLIDRRRSDLIIGHIKGGGIDVKPTAKFSEFSVRLLIELSDGKVIMVDSEGVVRSNGKDYMLKPSAYLAVYQIINYQIDEQSRP